MCRQAKQSGIHSRVARKLEGVALIKMGHIMRELMILIGELVFIAALQVVVDAVLDEGGGQKRVTKAVNIAYILISCFLLLRYVYNRFIENFAALVNFYF